MHSNLYAHDNDILSLFNGEQQTQGAPCACHVQGAYCALHGEYNPVMRSEPYGESNPLGSGMDGCGGGRRIIRKAKISSVE